MSIDCQAADQIDCHLFLAFTIDIPMCQAVLHTVHVTVFDQSYVVSAEALADTFFVANGE